MGLLIMIIGLLATLATFALSFTSFGFVVQGIKNKKISIVLLGCVGFLLLVSLIVPAVFFDDYRGIETYLLVFSITLSVYIMMLSFILGERVKDSIAILSILSFLCGMALFSGLKSNDFGSIAVSLFYVPLIGVVYIITSKRSLTLLNKYMEKDKLSARKK